LWGKRLLLRGRAPHNVKGKEEGKIYYKRTGRKEKGQGKVIPVSGLGPQKRKESRDR
jgi:hypothetical protein